MIKKGPSELEVTLESDIRTAVLCKKAIDLIKSGRDMDAQALLEEVKLEIELKTNQSKRRRRFGFKSLYNWRWKNEWKRI